MALVRVSIAAMKQHNQSNLERKGFIWVCISIWKSGQELKQGWNLEAGADAEAMEGCCLLACSSWLTQLLSYRIQYHQSMDGSAHNGLGPSPLIIT